ncbi:MAG: hypothetical protein AB7O49_06420 [Sphingomonadales bacterium]
MKQSKVMSLAEALLNVIVGYGAAVLGQMAILPLFGLHPTLRQNLTIGAVFTVLSIVRSFALRRLFEALRTRAAAPEGGGIGTRSSDQAIR